MRKTQEARRKRKGQETNPLKPKEKQDYDTRLPIVDTRIHRPRQQTTFPLHKETDIVYISRLGSAHAEWNSEATAPHSTAQHIPLCSLPSLKVQQDVHI